MGEVSPGKPAVFQGDSPSSSRSADGSSTDGPAGGGIIGSGGLGLTAHAMSRMEQVNHESRALICRLWAAHPFQTQDGTEEPSEERLCLFFVFADPCLSNQPYPERRGKSVVGSVFFQQSRRVARSSMTVCYLTFPVAHG